jgi:hypothetical protein
MSPGTYSSIRLINHYDGGYARKRKLQLVPAGDRFLWVLAIAISWIAFNRSTCSVDSSPDPRAILEGKHCMPLRDLRFQAENFMSSGLIVDRGVLQLGANGGETAAYRHTEPFPPKQRGKV